VDFLGGNGQFRVEKNPAFNIFLGMPCVALSSQIQETLTFLKYTQLRDIWQVSKNATCREMLFCSPGFIPWPRPTKIEQVVDGLFLHHKTNYGVSRIRNQVVRAKERFASFRTFRRGPRISYLCGYQKFSLFLNLWPQGYTVTPADVLK
jgi:hypothetical protein